MGTIPQSEYDPARFRTPDIAYAKGQSEIGSGGYEHVQCLVWLSKKGSLASLRRLFPGTSHWELTRSESAECYVWKDASAVPDTRFEFGVKPIRRNSKPDWDNVWDSAKSGRFELVPASLRVVHYRTLKAIASDYALPVAIERTATVFWGKTGTGKSRDAWAAAGLDAYPKGMFVGNFRSKNQILVWLPRSPMCCGR